MNAIPLHGEVGPVLERQPAGWIRVSAILHEPWRAGRREPISEPLRDEVLERELGGLEDLPDNPDEAEEDFDLQAADIGRLEGVVQQVLLEGVCEIGFVLQKQQEWCAADEVSWEE